MKSKIYKWLLISTLLTIAVSSFVRVIYERSQENKNTKELATDSKETISHPTPKWFMLTITKHDTKGKVTSHTVKIITGSDKDSIYDVYWRFEDLDEEYDSLDVREIDLASDKIYSSSVYVD